MARVFATPRNMGKPPRKVLAANKSALSIKKSKVVPRLARPKRGRYSLAGEKALKKKQALKTEQKTVQKGKRGIKKPSAEVKPEKAVVPD